MYTRCLYLLYICIIINQIKINIMSTAIIQPEYNQGFPIETHPFYNWSMVKSLIGYDIIENILRIDLDSDSDNEYIENLEDKEPRITQKLFEDIFKLQQECIESGSLDPYTEALDIVNLMAHNQEMLDESEMLSIPRVKDFSNAYSHIFRNIIIYFDING